MARIVEFPVPRGMTPIDIAKTLSAYLQGPLAFENSKDERNRYRQGPYPKHGEEGYGWQLDSTNDFWLHLEGNQARVGCRYPGQEAVVEAMVALFKLRFLSNPQDAAA